MDSVAIYVGDWQCPFCRFHRTFTTQKGVLEGAGKHLLQVHKKRLELAPSQPRPEPRQVQSPLSAWLALYNLAVVTHAMGANRERH